jgi:hypothetical protein
MQTITEYEIPSTDGEVFGIEMPTGSTVMAAGTSDEGDPVFWAFGRAEATTQTRRFIVKGAGDELPLVAGIYDEFARYVYCGRFKPNPSEPDVLHLFELQG